jgi:hypothetical protein
MQRCSPRASLSLLLALVALAGGSRARAQETVPKELALALNAAATEGGDILVGAMPADLARDFPLPNGGRVLGSLITTSYVQVVVALPGGPDSALAYARRTLLEHGWLAPDPMQPRTGGLQYAPSIQLPRYFCRPGSVPPDAISIATSFYGPTTTLLRLSRSRNPVCEQAAAGQRGFAERVEFVGISGPGQSPFAGVPPLFPPGEVRNAAVACRSTSGMGGRSSQGQQLQSALSPGEILAHYAKQLDSAGWIATTAVAGTWAKPDTANMAREVSITVSPMKAPGCYSVSLTASSFTRR